MKPIHEQHLIKQPVEVVVNGQRSYLGICPVTKKVEHIRVYQFVSLKPRT